MNATNHETKTRSTLAGICRATCRQLLERFETIKSNITGEFRGKVKEHEHLLHLAMNEAEALAWQTGFPQLFFPTLAIEKARGVASWHARQMALRRAHSAPGHNA